MTFDRALFGSGLAFCIGLFCLYNYYHPMVPLQERAIFSMLTLAALFLMVRPAKPRAVWRYADPVHAALAVLAFGYIAVDWSAILMRQGAPTSMDMWLGAVAIYLVLVASIRNLGAGLTGVIVFFLLYVAFGSYLPNWLGGHRGYSLERTFTFIFLSENGVLGFAIDTALKFMFVFLLLGKVLEHVGALGFIMEISRSVFGKGASGPPLMAVGSSALLGTMTGSSMSNVYISGSVTIPIMKRVGIRPEVAAAIEAAASNGSQIMPPVLGFAVFFMMVLLEVAYLDIVLVAIIPGCLYFASLFFSVWLRTRNLRPATSKIWDDEPTPVGKALLSVASFCFFGALGTLIAMLVYRFAVQTAVLAGILVCIVLSWFGPNKVGPGAVLRSIERSGRDIITISVICLALGLITGPILLTGLGTKLPALLADWSGGRLSLLLAGAFVACLILGAGIPTSLAYVIVALMMGNAMVELGVPKVAAHMFAFYGALAASITPPVALTSYAAATIAEADFWKTGWHAAFLGLPKYLVPFAFVYRPELLMTQGEAWEIAAATITTLLGLMALSYTQEIFGRHPLRIVAAAMMAAGGFLLTVPPLSAAILSTGTALVAIAGAVAWLGIGIAGSATLSGKTRT